MFWKGYDSSKTFLRPDTIRPTSYHRTLDYLFTQLPMFQRIGPMAFKKDLTNIVKACEVLGNPHHAFPSIHIAGTNGKWSVAHMLAAVFTAAGYKTGLYTSPHYRDFRERVKIDGQLIPKHYVVQFVERYKDVFEETKASFFEWTVALAFDYYRHENVDIAIIETGLGGRLDSTNIVTPLVSVITNIGFDHMNMLGETLPLIAGEKAGIIKPGVPVVIGETHPETAPVFLQKAQAEKAPITFADQILRASLGHVKGDTAFYTVTSEGKTIYDGLALQHLGKYQEKNLLTTLQSLHVFQQQYPEWFDDLEKSIRAGLTHLKKLSHFIGRWEYISLDPPVLVDSAHNEDGIRQLVDAFKSLSYNQLHFVIGMFNDKSHDKSFALLPKEAVYYFAKANIPRGLDASELQKHAFSFGLKGKAYSSIRRALAAAKRKAAKGDLIFVGGSIFTVAEVV